jgi:hypothetical protein
MNVNPDDLAKWASAVKDGILGLTVLFLVVGGMKGWYVWGWLHAYIVKTITEDRDEWKTQAIRAPRLIERAIEVSPPPKGNG